MTVALNFQLWELDSALRDKQIFEFNYSVVRLVSPGPYNFGQNEKYWLIFHKHWSGNNEMKFEFLNFWPKLTTFLLFTNGQHVISLFITFCRYAIYALITLEPIWPWQDLMSGYICVNNGKIWKFLMITQLWLLEFDLEPMLLTWLQLLWIVHWNFTECKRFHGIFSMH